MASEFTLLSLIGFKEKKQKGHNAETNEKSQHRVDINHQVVLKYKKRNKYRKKVTENKERERRSKRQRRRRRRRRGGGGGKEVRIKIDKNKHCLLKIAVQCKE